jgi:Zn-dependent protease
LITVWVCNQGANEVFMLGEPQRTQLDLNFSVFGFPVRVSAFFWLIALFLGWGLVRTNPKLIFIWVLAVFVSILIHELGHAFAFRYYGIAAHIVLYQFGGLAIPDSASAGFGWGRSRNPLSQIMISAAGPAVQLLLTLLIIVGVRLTGYSVPLHIPLVPPSLLNGSGTQIPNEAVYFLAAFLLQVNLYWALLNLLPIYPLDGGQIAREVFLSFDVRNGIRNSLMLSVVAAAGIAIYTGARAVADRDGFLLPIMFGLLAYSSYQTLQTYSGRGGGFGGGRPW